MVERLVRVPLTALILGYLLAMGTSAAAQVDSDSVSRQDLQFMVDSLVQAGRNTDYHLAEPAIADSLSRCALWFARSGAGRLTISQAVRMTDPSPIGYSQRLRWDRAFFEVDQRVLEVNPKDLVDYLAAVRMINNIDRGLQAHLDNTVGEAEREKIVRPVMTLYGELLAASLETSFEKLRRYEQKFGPRSARLNFVEAAFNGFFSRVPGFGPDENSWPGPWEIVSAYSSSYLGIREEAELTSLLEIGFRHYNFTPGWGENGGIGGILKPSYFSLGAVMSGEPDGVLINPLRGEERWGAFVAWGSLKIAYLLGDGTDRLLVSKQFQFLPGLF